MNTGLDILLNYNNCSYKNRQYFFTYEDGTEEEFIWNKIENHWDPSSWYRDPKPIIPDDLGQEEVISNSNSDSLHNQTPINIQNAQIITNMLEQGSETTPSMPTQPGRGKVKLSDNYTGDRIESQKFILQCLLFFAVESDRYKTNLDKVSLALSCMRHRTASTWAKNFLAKTVGAKTLKDLGI